MTDAPEETGVPLADLDWETLGRTVAMLAPISAYLRHASLDSTLRDYIHPEPLSEMDFVRDLFMEPLSEVVEKWYGGRMNATRLASEVMSHILDDLIPGGAAGYVARAKEAAAARREP